MSPCLLPIPLAPLLSRAPQSSKENLPKVGIVSMYPFKGHLDMCSTTIWVVRENMPLHNDTKSSFVNKSIWVKLRSTSTFMQTDFYCGCESPFKDKTYETCIIQKIFLSSLADILLIVAAFSSQGVRKTNNELGSI